MKSLLNRIVPALIFQMETSTILIPDLRFLVLDNTENYLYFFLILHGIMKENALGINLQISNNRIKIL